MKKFHVVKENYPIIFKYYKPDEYFDGELEKHTWYFSVCDWMGNEIEGFDDENAMLEYYDTLEDFAYYELTEGWYIDNHLDEQDYHGAPNPIDYIDLEALGEALITRGDESCIYRTEGDQVVTTDWGWS